MFKQLNYFVLVLAALFAVLAGCVLLVDTIHAREAERTCEETQ